MSKSRSFFPETVPARIFLPVLLSLFLFIGTFFGYILPRVEENLMDRKREMILALSESAMSSVQYYARMAEAGLISEEQAKQEAIDLLRNIRYGPENKDYFWINDTGPNMIMHPYRTDLEGKYVGDTEDSQGKKLFRAFLEMVEKSGGGYVDYFWQWQDDPTRIFSKISYVQEFRPWQWIIGTGVYVEDVHAQLDKITRHMTFFFLAILGLISILSLYIIWQGAAGESHRREIAESLKQSENKYRLLAETAREFIFLFNSHMKVTYANTAWLKTSEYTAAEMDQKNIIDLIPPDLQPQFREKIRLIEEDRTNDFLLDSEFILKSGTTISIEATFAKLDAEDQADAREQSSIFLLNARDTTERKKIEAQEKLQQEQMMQTDKMISLGTLVSGVAHEINNPISSIMLNIKVFDKFWQSAQPILDQYYEENGKLDVGIMDYSQFRERMPQLLAYSHEGVERVKRIVGDLKDFSGQTPSDHRETVNLNEVVEKAIGLVSSLVKKATNDFQVSYFDNLPTMLGNSQRLGQVVINLIVNACQALTDPAQGVHVTTGYLEESEEIFVEVRDYGGGMEKEVLERIKDPFFTTKRDSGGTGLGLSISDTIVRNHGGWLHFSSDGSSGTTATVLLPRYSPDEVIGRMI